MADYNEQFLEACEGGQLEEAKQLILNHPDDVDINHSIVLACKYRLIEITKWLVNECQVNNHENNVKTFRWACYNGQIEIAKWLVHDHQVDVHVDDDSAFRMACINEHIELAKWLIHDHQVNVHAYNEHVFRWACIHKHIKMINWFIDEYIYSQSPYYYHNRTGYILNHEPLKKWQSCTILGCPVIYHGELDEPAVIAYMATLKKPKSARS